MKYFIIAGSLVVMACMVIETEAQAAEPCPDMSLPQHRNGFYVLDLYNNQVYYTCLPNGQQIQMPCAPGTCAFFPNGKMSSGSRRSPCSLHASHRICQEGNRTPPPPTRPPGEKPPGSCYTQSAVLDKNALPTPTETDDCDTACLIHWDSVRNIFLRTCMDPTQTIPDPGCYGNPENPNATPEEIKYVCATYRCNRDPITDIAQKCFGDYQPLF